MRTYFIYITSNPKRNVLYIGVTNNLERRIKEHKTKRNPRSFSAQFNCNALVYFEEYKYILNAIYREKQLKGWRRSKKDTLIDGINPERLDLAADWYS